MDGKRAKRGQPEAAKHWHFKRHLNTLNLAPGKRGSLPVENIYSFRHDQVTIRLGGSFEGGMKILELYFFSCPEEVLHISGLLSEGVLACFQLSKKVDGFRQRVWQALTRSRLQNVSMSG